MRRTIQKRLRGIALECPTDRCKMNDCYVAYPLSYSRGRWWWATHDTSWVERGQLSPNVMRERYTPTTPLTGTPELWCFTKQQLKSCLDCKL